MRKRLYVKTMVTVMAIGVFWLMNYPVYSQEGTAKSEEESVTGQLPGSETQKDTQARKKEFKLRQRLISKYIFELLSDAEKKELRALKEQDPQKYKEALKEKINQHLNYLKDLKENNPEKFKEEMQKLQAAKRQRGLARELAFENISEEEKAELAKLRQEDPKKFRQILLKKIEESRKHLEELKTNNPKEYENLVNRLKQNIRNRIEKFKKEHPEKFKEMMQRRRILKQRMMKRLCAENPEKCKKLREKEVEKLKKRLQELKAEDPQGYERITNWIRERRAESLQKGWDKGEHKGWQDIPAEGNPPHNFGQ